MSTEKRLSLQRMHLAKGARQKWDIIICLSIPQPTVSKLHGYDGYMGQKVRKSLQFFVSLSNSSAKIVANNAPFLR